MSDPVPTSSLFFSLIIPSSPDRASFERHVGNLCAILDDTIPGCYEVVAIEAGQEAADLSDWDHVRGEVFLVIDGNMEVVPTTLKDVVAAFNAGDDMTFASQYSDNGRVSEPDISYFGIKRASMPRLHESPEGQRLILEILGPETIKKLGRSSQQSGGYILGSLRSIIDWR